MVCWPPTPAPLGPLTSKAESCGRPWCWGGTRSGSTWPGTILEAFGRERVIEHVGDPFAFVDDYNEAASRLGGERHVFSGEALAGLQLLRDKFRR